MCKMTGHVYLVDGGVQNDHAQPGPLKVNTACWEGSLKEKVPQCPRLQAHYQPGVVVVSVWLLRSCYTTACYDGQACGMRCMWWRTGTRLSRCFFLWGSCANANRPARPCWTTVREVPPGIFSRSNLSYLAGQGATSKRSKDV